MKSLTRRNLGRRRARHTRRLRDSHGLSLLEVCASITVFGLIVGGLTSSTIGIVRTTATSRHSTAAAALIQETVERFRAIDPATEPAEFAAGYHADPNNPINGYGEEGGSYLRSWTVTRNNPQAGVAQVVIEVTWSDPKPRTLTAITFVCQTDTCS